MTKPSLRDRRRQEAREALYRAVERRDALLDKLVRSQLHIKKLKRTLACYDVLDPKVISKLPVSVAEGKLIEARVTAIEGELNDAIPDLSRHEQYADYESALEGDR